jgi:hypothetical protein
MEITLNLETAGEFTEQEIRDYILYCLSFGSISDENPFVNEDGNAEIIDVDIY